MGRTRRRLPPFRVSFFRLGYTPDTIRQNRWRSLYCSSTLQVRSKPELVNFPLHNGPVSPDFDEVLKSQKSAPQMLRRAKKISARFRALSRMTKLGVKALGTNGAFVITALAHSGNQKDGGHQGGDHQQCSGAAHLAYFTDRLGSALLRHGSIGKADRNKCQRKGSKKGGEVRFNA